MVVYVGVMDKGTCINGFKIFGDSIEVLCNNVTNSEGMVVGPMKFNIDSSYLEVNDCFFANIQHLGYSIPRNYREVLKEVSERHRTGESIIALFTREAMPVDCFLCGDYPRDEKVYVARVKEKFVSEHLAKFGRRFD